MSKKKCYFDEKTVKSSHSSNLSSLLDHIPERLSDIEISLVRSSLNLETSTPNPPKAAEWLSRERSLAASSLSRMDSIGPRDLTSLPSRYLRYSHVSSNSPNNFHTESTISESDLLPENSSTPRESALSNFEYMMKEPSRGSRGQSLTNLAQSLRNTDCDFGKVMDNIMKTMDSSFCSGDKAVEMFKQDEMSWKRENDIPAKLEEFSIRPPCVDSKMSVGSFFKERSDDLASLLAKSPEKVQAPVPLIDVSRDEKGDSLSVSAIAEMLSDTKQTPNRLLDLFTKPKPSQDKDNSACESESPIAFDEDSDALKENVSPNLPPLKSSLSSRSSSALSSLPNGKLPIGTTRAEIIWGCVKLGKSASQDFVINNRSPNRLGIKCSTANPAFKIVKDSCELTSSLKIILHPFESRCLSVLFAPISQGAAYDLINFVSVDPTHNQLTKQFIRLFGYGGHAHLTVNDVLKDTAGRFILPFGTVVENGVCENRFILRNAGTLPSFAYLEFIPSAKLFSNLRFSKQTVVLLPDEETEVVVTYEFKKQELLYIQSKRNCSVLEIGKLSLVHGAEVNRGRLRRVCAKAKDKGLEVRVELENLIAKFPGEVMPSDLKCLKEATASRQDVASLLNYLEIILTVEQDLDSTMVELQDETTNFTSLCENTALENTVSGALCSVEPSEIVLTPPFKVGDMVFLTNSSRKKAYFEIMSMPEGLLCKPREGTVDAGEVMVVQVSYKKVPAVKTVFKLKVLVDNEVCEVDVRINTLQKYKG